MPTAAIDIRHVPSAVRDAVEADARERDASVNDVQAGILASYFMFSWESSGYPYSGTTGATDQWLIRVPAKLKGVIVDHARGAGIPMRAIVLMIIERHYGLNITPARKRGPHQGMDPMLIREARARHADGESIRSISRDLPRSSGRGAHRETLTRAIRA